MDMGCLPQRAELVFLIPTIRKELAKELSKRHSETEVASKLGVTKSAISQYLHKKRAAEITLPIEIKDQIKTSAENIDSKKSTSIYEISKLLDLSMKLKFTCKVCNEDQCGQ